MADTDLLFQISAQDNNAGGTFIAEAAAVDRVTEAEQRNAAQMQTAAQSSADLAGATDKVSSSNESLSATADRAAQSSNDLAESTSKVSEETGRASVQIGGMQGVLLTLNAGIEISKAALEVFKQAWDFSKEGAAIQRVGAQFNQVAADFGVSGDEMIKAMDKAAHGTVDDEELMQVATRSMTQGVVTSQDQLVKFTEIARASAVRFGGDTAQVLQSILYATEVGAQRQLKATLGVVDFTKSYEELAKQLGKRKQDLTDEEMLQARVNAVLDKGAELVKKVGAAGEDNLTKMQRFEAQAANLFDVFKEGAVNALSPYLNNLDLLQKMNDSSASAQDKLRAEIQFLIDRGYTPESEAVQLLINKIREADAADERFKNTMGTLAGPIQEVTSGIVKQANEIVARVTDSSDLVNAITSEEAAMKRANDAYRDQIVVQSEARTLAISYTQDEQKLADLQGKLATLDAQIAAQGPVHTAQVNNQKMSEEQRALTLQKLAVAQENITQIQRKAGETDAEYNLRLSEAKGKVDSLSQSLGTHTVALGGATKAQEEQRKALQDQIDTFQKATEVQKATDVFNALTKAFQDGKLSADEYNARAVALNDVTHLYTKSALDAATQQELLVKSFTDPNSELWRGQLLKNEQALDGLANKATEAGKQVEALTATSQKPITVTAETNTAEAHDKLLALKETLAQARSIEPINYRATADTSNARDKLIELGQVTAQLSSDSSKSAKDFVDNFAKVKIPTLPAVDVDTAPAVKRFNDLFASLSDKAKTPVTAPVDVDIAAATQKLDDYYSGPIGNVSKPVLTKFDANTDAATGKANNLKTTINGVPTDHQTVMEVIADEAMRVIQDLLKAQSDFKNKTVTWTVIHQDVYEGGTPTSGNIPGAQAGANYIVPPNPRGGFGDYFPVMAAPGERVQITTPGQQAAQGGAGNQTSIINNETFNLYDTLITRQVSEQRRIDNLKSLVGVM